jgi:hypothetical protein
MQRIAKIAFGAMSGVFMVLEGIWFWSNLPNNDLRFALGIGVESQTAAHVADPLALAVHYAGFALWFGIWFGICFFMEDELGCTILLIFLSVGLAALGIGTGRLVGEAVESSSFTGGVIQIALIFTGSVLLIVGISAGASFMQVIAPNLFAARWAALLAVPLTLLFGGVFVFLSGALGGRNLVDVVFDVLRDQAWQGIGGIVGIISLFYTFRERRKKSQG